MGKQEILNQATTDLQNRTCVKTQSTAFAFNTFNCDFQQTALRFDSKRVS